MLAVYPGLGWRDLAEMELGPFLILSDNAGRTARRRLLEQALAARMARVDKDDWESFVQEMSEDG
jgi:hypothetical protein